jgi:hypothetical protein
MKRIIVLGTVYFLLTGCQTMRLISASQEAKDCAEKVKDSPAYQTISRHWPTMVGLDKPTEEHLTNNTYPTAGEVQALILVHNDVAVCRGRTIEMFSDVFPAIIPVVVQSYQEADEVDTKIIQGKMTWGEANKQYMIGKAAMQNRMMTALAQAEEIERKAEAETQQAVISGMKGVVDGVFKVALAALAAWSIQQNNLFYNRQMYYGGNRPTITNCSMSNYDALNVARINCSSY